jgi:hypothetical protein
VVVHQLVDEKNPAAAQKYLYAVRSRIIADYFDDADALDDLSNLSGYLIALTAVVALAKKHEAEVDEYFAEFCGEG